MGILDDNPLATQGDGEYWLANDLLQNISNAIGRQGLKRVVIDITYGKVVEVLYVASKSDQVLRAINLEDLLRNAPLTELGLDKPESKE